MATQVPPLPDSGGETRAMFRVRGESFSADEGEDLVHSLLLREVMQMLVDANLPFR